MPMTADQITNARLILSDQGTDAQQRLSIENATGGTFTLTFSGQTTSALAFNASAGDVQNALSALSNVGVGNVLATLSYGVPNISYYDIQFTGTLAGIAQPVTTVTSSLTGTAVAVALVQTQAGGSTVFSDAELNSQYDLANGNFFLAISYLFNVLWSASAKFNDYVAGQSNEKVSQIVEHLQELAQYYYRLAFAGSQVQIASFQKVPPLPVAVPNVSGVPAVSLNYAPPFSRRRLWGGR